ncbi:MAG: hypothetical protein ACR2NP_22345 [Pirellulaceae bacterium]
MQTISTSWDDISCNRTIEMDVTCKINDSDISIQAITPTRVITRFDNGDTERIIRVHTPAGRRHLLNKIDVESIRTSISEREMAIALR